MNEDKSEFLLEIKTVQVSAFRTLIEALKEILTDANFEFESNGIKLIAMDTSHTVLVHLKLNHNLLQKLLFQNLQDRVEFHVSIIL